MKISVISVIQNERQHIERFLSSARKYADEIIVGVLQGVDGTEEYLDTQKDINVVKLHKDTILAFGYSYPKNKLMSLASGDWYVFLDADEEFTFTREELEHYINQAENLGKTALATRTMFFPGDPNTSIESRTKTYDQNHWRICKAADGYHWFGIVHEHLNKYGQHVSLDAIESPLEMLHYSPLYDQYDSLLVYELMMRSYDIGAIQMKGTTWWCRGNNYHAYREKQKEFWMRRDVEFYPYINQKLPAYGTHLPLLKKAVECFKPKRIAEFGVGHFSTPYLQSLNVCLHSYELDISWSSKFRTSNSIIHSTYDYVPLNYDLVFVDHGDIHKRKETIERFKDSIVVVHDTDHDLYGYHLVLSNFKYIYTDTSIRPWTTVVSNHHDVTVLGGGIPFYVPVHKEFYL